RRYRGLLATVILASVLNLRWLFARGNQLHLVAIGKNNCKIPDSPLYYTEGEVLPGYTITGYTGYTSWFQTSGRNNPLGGQIQEKAKWFRCRTFRLQSKRAAEPTQGNHSRVMDSSRQQ